MKNSCCIIGNNRMVINMMLEKSVKSYFEHLIVDNGITDFYYSSSGDFVELCRYALLELKEKYVDVSFTKFNQPIVCEINEKTRYDYFEFKSYQTMIDYCDYCVFYVECFDFMDFDTNLDLSYKYAKNCAKNIKNFWK